MDDLLRIRNKDDKGVDFFKNPTRFQPLISRV